MEWARHLGIEVKVADVGAKQEFVRGEVAHFELFFVLKTDIIFIFPILIFNFI